MAEFPHLMQTVLDTTEPRALAEFYRKLLGLHYRPGDEPPERRMPDDPDWLVLLDRDESRTLAFQKVPRLTRTTWPRHEVPMQIHLDCTVSSVEELERHRHRAEMLGAELLMDRSADAEEPLCVFADPSGHPFCIMVH